MSELYSLGIDTETGWVCYRGKAVRPASPEALRALADAYRAQGMHIAIALEPMAEAEIARRKPFDPTH